MKKILIIALILTAFAAQASTPATKEVKATTPVQTPAAAPTAVGAPDNSAKFVGTNDLNLFLLRDGIKKA
jgi:hypothetical protein